MSRVRLAVLCVLGVLVFAIGAAYWSRSATNSNERN
jgi:hypothetical protein